MRQILPTVALILALTACGGSGTDPMTAAQDALSAGDYAKAAELLEGYVATLDKGDAAYKDATIAYCEALAEEHPGDARATFGMLVADLGEAVTPRDFRYITSHLQTHGHYSEAVDLMDAGLKKWPGDETMAQVKDAIIAAVKQAGDADATKKLEGLGYL